MMKMEIEDGKVSGAGVGGADGVAARDRVLRETFGHAGFRAGQEAVIGTLLEGRPALAVFPTGAGKSLCYQLPALLLDGLTLVVSPLIALMKDQVEALEARGVSVARLDSSLEAAEVRAIYDRMAAGDLKLLYVAPERLANEGFLDKLRRTRISLVAIDEAHCISEWGHNFRPDYLKLGRLTRELGVARVLALTATATPEVAADIRESLGIREEDHVQTGFRRANLRFEVTPCAAAERRNLLRERIRSRPPGPSIVYVTLQRTAEEVAGFLARDGLRARAYHAGMRDEDRAEVQDGFMAGAVDIVVATIAFGMGIDKADIRYVYHYNLPKSLENYVQESGRAGRDGGEAVCEILACGDDRIVLENFVFGDTPSRAALRMLVDHLLRQGDRIEVSRYDLSGTLDIRPLVVATALTYLELNGVLESLGPFYASFRFRFLHPMEKVLAGHDADRRAFLEKLFGAATAGRTWRTIEVAETAETIGEPEVRIRRALHYLAEIGDLVTQPSGLRHAYRVNGDRRADRAAVARELEALFENRERGEIARIDRVVAHCRSTECLTRGILGYFGESMDAACGACTSCRDGENGTASGGERHLPCGLDPEPTLDQVAVIEELARERHAALRQPRQLARFLCGISSPAATRQRLHRDPRFGALAEVPFQAVLAQVESMPQ